MIVTVLILAYLLGSLSFAVLVSRALSLPDPRSHGSGNPGATNMLRTGRKSAAVLTLLGDMAKGVLAVWLAGYAVSHFALPVELVYGAALAVFLGHLYPIFFGFKGGKGVATALGVLFALSLWLGLACLLTWALVFVVTRISSLAALVATLVAPIFAYFMMDTAAVLALLVLTALIFWRHRANIARLLAGQEGGFKKPRV
ncbi:MAG: glycerol-3-phosphate 1-O-acyltransferase PlsY [Sulfuriferula sp.]|nr:glycerol-3-phosphate 1-O-acyltransferase PlsY [Sulfuriferula sp.]